MSYVLYAKLTPEQSAAVVALHPKWDPMDFYRFEFWVNKNGQASRKRGHHQLSEAASNALMREIKDLERSGPSSAGSGPTPTKDMPKRYTGSPAMHLGSNKD